MQVMNKSVVNQPKIQVKKVSPEDRPMESNNGKQLWAKSYLNRAAPQLKVEKWLTEVPDTEGKFVLIDFWGPSCSPCRKSIPDLNRFSKQFKDKLVVIGVSLNKEEQVRAMKEPVIEYYSAIDTKKEYIGKFEIKGYPHAILLDTRGLFVGRGIPCYRDHELTAEVIENLITKYDYEDGGVQRAWAKTVFRGKGTRVTRERMVPEGAECEGEICVT